MNGTSDPNFPEAGKTGAYSGAVPSGSGADPAGNYTGSGNYTSAGGYGSESTSYAAGGSSNTGPAGDPHAGGSVPPPPPGYVPPYSYSAPPPVTPGAPNPGLAVLLGFIPGVGAMYNGQFAKGIVHIIIFAVLTKVAEHVDIFGLFVAGWVFYMVFDAYQTARARRDGLVVPDPFGLNDIGERFGMPTNPNWGDFVARPAATQAADTARTSNPYAGPPVDPATGNPAPGYGYAGAAAGPSPYSPPVPPAGYPAGTGSQPWQPEYPEAFRQGAYPDAGVASNPAYQAAYVPVDSAAMPPFAPGAFNPAAPTRSGLPVGAIWLIGLGLLALVGSLGHNVYWTGRYFGGLIPIALGIALIVQRALAAKKFYPEGSAAHRWYILHQSRAGILLVVVGGLTLLSSLGLLYWYHSWPYLLILFGLLQVADRAAYNRMLAENPPGYPYGAPAPAAATAAATAASTAASDATATSSTEQEVR